MNIHSLKAKMFLAILLCFIFVVVFTIVNNIFAIAIIKNKTNSSLANTAGQTNRYLSFLFNKARDIAYVTSLNKNLETLSGYKDIDFDNYFNFYLAIHDLYTFIWHQTEFNREIHSMYIYMDQIQYFINAREGIYSRQLIKDSAWLETVLSVDDNHQWITNYYDKDFTGRNLISMVYRADFVNWKVRTPVYIGVNFLESDILEILQGMQFTPNSMVYLIDGSHNILVTNDKPSMGKTIEDIADIKLEDFEKKQSMRIKMERGNYYQAIYRREGITKGGIVVLIPEKELLAEQRRMWVVLIVIIVLTLMIFIVLGMKMVIDYVDKPISKLVSFMEKAEQGDFDQRIQEERKDEFGYLYVSYNQMVDKIKRLIEELFQEKLLKSEMEVKVLQEQINPHFLYNTLDTVNWIAKANKIDSISKIVISLSDMYRITFNQGGDYIKISEMIQGIRCYLDIQEIRYGESFDYSIEIDEKIEEWWVMNLILQTIVENAIIHGIDDYLEDGYIEIKAFKDGDRVHFIVQDNGKGMTEEKLELIKAIINNDNIVSKSGLCNVQRRLRLLYGTEYGLEIDSWEGKGTRVDVFLPIIENIECEDPDAGDEEYYYD